MDDGAKIEGFERTIKEQNVYITELRRIITQQEEMLDAWEAVAGGVGSELVLTVAKLLELQSKPSPGSTEQLFYDFFGGGTR